MKGILALKFLMVAVLLCNAGPQLVVSPPGGQVKLSWSYPTDQLNTNISFNFYETTNIATPFSNYNFLTNIPGPATNALIAIVPGEHFIVSTASNFWQETSITSNMVHLPPLPVPINDSLRIERVP